MRVLFFMPHFGKTGSAMTLFDLMKHAKNNYFEVGLCVINGGAELLKNIDFPISYFNYEAFREEKLRQVAVAATFTSRVKRFAGKLLSGGKTPDIIRYDINSFMTNVMSDFKPDICYVNTITLHPEVKYLADHKFGRIILHSHESENMLTGFASNRLKVLLTAPQKIIVPSQRTGQMFNLLGRNAAISVFPSPVDFERVKIDSDRISKLRKLHHIEAGDFVWCMSGTIDPNKDTVAFIELAKRVVSRFPTAKFIWLGKAHSAYFDYCVALIGSYGLRNNILLIEADDTDYFNYLELCNAFVLTSKQDTFPLVMLEAAYLEKPILSFDSGGISEFLGERFQHLIIKERSVEMMSSYMIDLMNGNVLVDCAELKKMADAFSVKNSLAKWIDIITKN